MTTEVLKVIGKTLTGIVSTLALGELFGGVVSRPIAAYRMKGIDESRVIDMMEKISERVYDLEEKQKVEA